MGFGVGPADANLQIIVDYCQEGSFFGPGSSMDFKIQQET